MRYLFFDIESADGYVSICEFGYIITDENFNIIQKHNYLMNPAHKWNLGSKAKPRIDLHHSHAEYERCPEFDNFYDNIKYLLTQKDVKIFGFSVGNDVGYVGTNCSRYHLPSFDYVAYDIQQLHRKLINDNKITSLEEAVKIVPKEEWKNLPMHDAVGDSIMTMLILKTITKKLNKSVSQLLDDVPNAKINAIAHNKHLKERALERKKWRESHQGECAWVDYSRSFKEQTKNGENLERTISVTRIAKEDLDHIRMVKEITKKYKLIPTNNIYIAKYIVLGKCETKEQFLSKPRPNMKGIPLSLDELKEIQDKNSQNI